MPLPLVRSISRMPAPPWAFLETTLTSCTAGEMNSVSACNVWPLLYQPTAQHWEADTHVTALKWLSVVAVALGELTTAQEAPSHCSTRVCSLNGLASTR